MCDTKSYEKWECECGYIGIYANSTRHIKTARHKKRLFLKNNPPPVKAPKVPKKQLTYLEKQHRSREIIDCPYCDMKSSRAGLKKHIRIQHDDKKMTSNYINNYL